VAADGQLQSPGSGSGGMAASSWCTP